MTYTYENFVLVPSQDDRFNLMKIVEVRDRKTKEVKKDPEGRIKYKRIPKGFDMTIEGAIDKIIRMRIADEEGFKPLKEIIQDYKSERRKIFNMFAEDTPQK